MADDVQLRDYAWSRPDLDDPQDGVVSNRSSEELDSLRHAREDPPNPLAECSRCHLHKNGEPAPYPDLCGVPAPEVKGNAKREPDFQDANGEPIPVVGRQSGFSGGGGRMRPPGNKVKIAGRTNRNGRCLGASVRLRERRAFTLTPTVMRKIQVEMQDRLKALADIPGALRSSEKRPLPPMALKLCRDLLDHERFCSLISGGFPIPAAGMEALRLKSPTSAYGWKDRIAESGGPDGLFHDRAIELFGRDGHPWGHQTEDSDWALFFFTRLAGGTEEVERLRSECRSLSYARNALARYSEDEDIATIQSILFFVGSGEFGGVG